MVKEGLRRLASDAICVPRMVCVSLFNGSSYGTLLR